MGELSGHDCPRCNVELFVEASEDTDGVDLLICKQCWGVGVTAKSMAMVMSEGSLLDSHRDQMVNSKSSGDCKCPLCSEIMDEIEIGIPDEIYEKISMIESESKTSKNVIIDSCNSCPTFWFDAGELDLLNGIKPKLRGEKIDSKRVRLQEDPTLSPEDLKKRMNTRRAMGMFAILFCTLIWDNGPFGFVLASLITIGGLIAILTKNPEVALLKGTCDKCLEPDKLLAWNCQSGGCWAHICSDCQNIGEDPVEAYAKTLGKVAVGTVMVGVGVGVLVATQGAVGEEVFGVAGEIFQGDTEKSMLLCKECEDRFSSQKEKRKDLKEKRKKKGTGDFTPKNITLTGGYCNHKFGHAEDKKCRRMAFRGGSYCYMHKDLYKS